MCPCSVASRRSRSWRPTIRMPPSAQGSQPTLLDGATREDSLAFRIVHQMATRGDFELRTLRSAMWGVIKPADTVPSFLSGATAMSSIHHASQMPVRMILEGDYSWTNQMGPWRSSESSSSRGRQTLLLATSQLRRRGRSSSADHVGGTRVEISMGISVLTALTDIA